MNSESAELALSQATWLQRQGSHWLLQHSFNLLLTLALLHVLYFHIYPALFSFSTKFYLFYSWWQTAGLSSNHKLASLLGLMQSMNSAKIPGLLKCNTVAAGGEGRFQRRVRPLECQGDYSALGMLECVGSCLPEAFLAQTATLWSKRCIHCPLGYV